MIRLLLLLTGVILLIAQQCFHPLPDKVQFIMFITGIVLVGIPHGAADLLVATRNAENTNSAFSLVRFFVTYLGRLVLFAVILWFFPLAGNLLFIVFAAYHFGETDLHEFKTNTMPGKIFVLSYGLVILGVILLNHFEEVQPLYLQFNSGIKNQAFINYISQFRYTILSFTGILFFISAFVYFSMYPDSGHQQGLFLVRFALIVFILYHLPMILGFTFYFIFWHSLISLRNIINYLRKNNLYSMGSIVKQLALYSMLAIAGLSIFGLTGSMFISKDAMTVYVFLGLAVLTAPHMEVMHEMYKSIREKSSI